MDVPQFFKTLLEGVERMDWYVEPWPRIVSHYPRTIVGGILTMLHPVIASVLITFVLLVYFQNQYSNIDSVAMQGKRFEVSFQCNAVYGCQVFYNYDESSSCWQDSVVQRRRTRESLLDPPPYYYAKRDVIG